MNTTENNKIIAEFMNKPTFKTDGWVKIEYELLYHSDWNWLMEVIEKIESLNYSTEIKSISGLGHTMFFISGGAEVPLSRRLIKTKFEAVYNACVEFIKWYNLNK